MWGAVIHKPKQVFRSALDILPVRTCFLSVDASGAHTYSDLFCSHVAQILWFLVTVSSKKVQVGMVDDRINVNTTTVN